MPRSPIIGRLPQPSLSVLPDLVGLGQQQSFNFNRRNSENANFGSVTAARNNSKPFIIGFIPPDEIINFIPFDKVDQTVAGIEVARNNGDASGFRSIQIPSNIPKYSPGPAGEVPRQRVTVSGAEVRQSLAQSYAKIIGTKPTDAQLALLYGQMVAESGNTPASFTAYNYNLGNAETGKHGTFAPGPYGEWKGARKKDASGRDLPPEPGHTGPPPDVKGTLATAPEGAGRHYVSWGATGKDEYYPTAYTAFDNLDQYTDHYISLLARGYPDSLRATTPETFNQGLKDGNFGSYHQTPDDTYIANISRGANYYEEKFADANDGLVLRQDQPPIPEDQEISRAIMSHGTFSATENDPIGDRIGRGIRPSVDDGKIAIVKEQTDYLRQQVQRLASTPPLLFLINPSDFNRQFQHQNDNSPKTRFGNISHRWLERPLEITCSGVTAAQYAFNAEGAGGLTTENRVHSISYQNLLSIVGIYKNNGIIYANGGRKGAHNGVAILGFSIYIYYDGHIYIGSFDTFSVKDDSAKPHNMSYDLKFICRYHENINDDINGAGVFDSSIASRAIGR